jgi:hypothetical protein
MVRSLLFLLVDAMRYVPGSDGELYGHRETAGTSIEDVSRS